MNKRSCHVLLCKENESLDVITTVGQAFELRYSEYMQTQQINEEHDEHRQQVEFVYSKIKQTNCILCI